MGELLQAMVASRRLLPTIAVWAGAALWLRGPASSVARRTPRCDAETIRRTAAVCRLLVADRIAWTASIQSATVYSARGHLRRVVTVRCDATVDGIPRALTLTWDRKSHELLGLSQSIGVTGCHERTSGAPQPTHGLAAAEQWRDLLAAVNESRLPRWSEVARASDGNRVSLLSCGDRYRVSVTVDSATGVLNFATITPLQEDTRCTR